MVANNQTNNNVKPASNDLNKQLNGNGELLNVLTVLRSFSSKDLLTGTDDFKGPDKGQL